MDGMEALWFNSTKEGVTNMINEVGADGSGTIEYEEFQAMVQVNMLYEKEFIIL